MSDELKSKLSQLQQRRKARETTHLLPKEVLEGADLNRFSYKEDVYSTHSLELFPKGVEGKYVYPEGYSVYEYVEVDQLAHLVRCIEESGLVFDSEVFVSLDNDSAYWPLSQEKIGKFLAWYFSCLENSYQELVIFQADFKKGIVVDKYCGYLPKGMSTNANETVYEFVYWEK
ncbi:hypothetical protein KCM76_23965 [Zooshikella marina]|uniref:hypothetical protein n=1 Tax=Zooshikella ganghwensis TaxID=202772 RepID=UPI001BAF241B|nr:hypothetical protein [Zooshikella ganghwensis]MBU2709073.1 hypothetical protein [Zooshikella ganghwensis]